MSVDAVERPQLRAEMIHQRFGAQRFAGDALKQLGGRVALALGVDLLAEPLPQRFELPGGELLVEGRGVLEVTA